MDCHHWPGLPHQGRGAFSRPVLVPVVKAVKAVDTPTLSQKSSQPALSMETLKTINPLNKGTGTAVEALDSTMAKMGMGIEGQKRATSMHQRRLSSTHLCSRPPGVAAAHVARLTRSAHNHRLPPLAAACLPAFHNRCADRGGQEPPRPEDACPAVDGQEARGGQGDAPAMHHRQSGYCQ